jgi:hypothetical protein
MENNMKILQKVNHDPVIQLLGIYPKEYKSVYNKDTCTAALFTTTKLGNNQRAL